MFLEELMPKYQHKQTVNDEMIEIGNFEMKIGEVGLLKDDLTTESLGAGMMKSYDFIPANINENTRMFITIDLIEYDPDLFSKLVSNTKYEDNKFMGFYKKDSDGHIYKSLILINERDIYNKSLYTKNCLKTIYVFPKVRVNKFTFRARGDNDVDPIGTYTFNLECFPKFDEDNVMFIKSKMLV
jgi:hypothetical protein